MNENKKDGENKQVKVKKGVINMMNMYENFPVANLKDKTLKKIETLEKELREETGENIVLIAYDEEK